MACTLMKTKTWRNKPAKYKRSHVAHRLNKGVTSVCSKKRKK